MYFVKYISFIYENKDMYLHFTYLYLHDKNWH